ncbi:MAG: 23S rRNA (uracil(1939)-C(5))-methyltransferase RlmD [Patescibacteria group bacterium]
MKYGHKLKLKIDGYDDHGKGIAQAEIVPGEWRPIAVPFACKGDELDAIFVKRDQGIKICRIESITKPSPDRIEPTCPHAGICGGCLWQNLDYTAQLKEKEDGVKRLFSKLKLQDVVRSIVPAQEVWGYRNRMDYCVGWNSEVGLKEYGAWNKYLNIIDCPLLSSHVGPILQLVRDWMKQFSLTPWDAKFHVGDVRYVVIREGKNTDQRMVNIVIFDKTKITPEARQWLVDKLAPSATTLLLGQQNKPTDISLAQEFEVLKGDLFLVEEVNGITYKIHPNSFFQTNTKMASVLQQVVLDELRDSSYVLRNVLDMYCGLGFFGIAAAKSNPGLKVFGFELDEPAVELAKENAILNTVQNQCEFMAGKAEDLSWVNQPADAVIIDPPRSGLHPRVIKALCSMNPETLIYVSCNYHRLESELPELQKSFKVVSITPIDLFPNTPHVEVVLHLSSRTSSEAI